MGKGLETLKNITKDKNKEKIIYILLAAVVILIASSYIFKEDESKNKQQTIIKEENKKETKYIYTSDELEQKLSSILSKIDGVSNVSCFITYKDNGKIVPLLTDNKEVIYNEESSKKEVLIEKTLAPEIEGIIIVAQGMSNQAIKAEISTALASVMNVPAYKVQIFNKEVVNWIFLKSLQLHFAQPFAC